jgi:hypothetical protein
MRAHACPPAPPLHARTLSSQLRSSHGGGAGGAVAACPKRKTPPKFPTIQIEDGYNLRSHSIVNSITRILSTTTHVLAVGAMYSAL